MAELDPTSVLGDLAQKRQQIINEQLLTLRVPDWEEPQFWITYRPAQFEHLRALREKISNSKGKKETEATLNGNADILVKNCVEVFAKVLVEGEWTKVPLGEDGTPGTFGSELLADQLQVTDRRAIAVCRALFLKDGDLLSHSVRLGEWSGLNIENVEESTSGE